MNNPQEWLKKRISRVLLATDLQQNSRLALNYAVDLARLTNSTLRSLYVFEYGPWGQSVEVLDHVPSRERKEAQEALQKFLTDSGHADVASEVVVEESHVTTAIIKVLKQRAIDLLVIGTEGLHSGVDHLVLGSNTEALMLGSQTPILTVGPEVPEPIKQDLQYKKVIYVSDFSVASTTAATYAYALSEALGVTTQIQQLASKAARQNPEKLKRAAAQYCDLLRFTDSALPSDWYDVDVQLSRLIVEEDLIALASESSNLLVLGVQAASFLQRHLHTSLA